MTVTQVKQQILKTLTDGMETVQPVTEQTHLIRDLGLSSMETMMVITDLEDQFGIRIPASRLRSVQTVGDLMETVIAALR